LKELEFEIDRVIETLDVFIAPDGDFRFFLSEDDRLYRIQSIRGNLQQLKRDRKRLESWLKTCYQTSEHVSRPQGNVLVP